MRHSCIAGQFRTSFLIALGSAALIVAGLTGCDGNKPQTSSKSAISAAAASERDAAIDSGHGEGYTYQITYPQLSARMATLTAALRAFADKAKQEFVSERTTSRTTQDPAFSLEVEFDIARNTADFVSVLASGSEFTGGAHGLPIQASFNWHRTDAKLVTLAELFNDPDAALRALSDETRRQLEGRLEVKLRDETASMSDKQAASYSKEMKSWIEKGTEPVAQNFDVFLVDGLDTQAIGLTFIFPPYQVASYADGAQQVEVPAKVFYKLLKPQYRDAFAIDTEADKLGAAAR